MIEVPLTRPWLGPEEQAAVAQVLDSGWLVQGPWVARFERAVAERAGAAHAVATSSGTTALQVALAIHGIGPGHEVVVPSLTWIATANVIALCGARPVFADVDAGHFGLTASSVAAMLGPRSRAVLVVHQFGFPCDLTGIAELLAERGLLLIEDAACALGSLHQQRPIGSHGHTACFSFHPRKPVTTGEGGMITTADPGLARRARSLIDHGSTDQGFAEPGSNYRMTDLQGALGTVQMERLDAILAGRRRVAQCYAAELGGTPGLLLPAAAPGDEPNWQSYPLRVLEGGVARRDQIASGLLQAGVACRTGYLACHRQPAFRISHPEVELPVTEELLAQLLLLPIYPQMTEAEQAHVLAALRGELARATPGAAAFARPTE